MVRVPLTAEELERGQRLGELLRSARGDMSMVTVAFDAGIMLDGQGLKPTSAGARLVFEGGTTSVVDGPFTESKEIIAGFWLWEVSSLEEAVEWAKKCPVDPDSGLRQVLELRPIFEAEDFGDEFTPELREKEAALAERIREQHPNG
jgi:hypothetical protein